MNQMPHGHVHIAPGYELVPDETQGRRLLAHSEGQIPLTMDQARILERCNGASTVDDIAEDMQREAPTIDPNETRAFLAVAYANNWIHGQ